MVLKEMGVLTMIYSYVADCRCCEVGYLIIIGLSLLFSNYSTYVFITFCFVFFISILRFLYCFLYCFVYYLSFCAVSFLFLYESIDRCHRVETQLQ